MHHTAKCFAGIAMHQSGLKLSRKENVLYWFGLLCILPCNIRNIVCVGGYWCDIYSSVYYTYLIVTTLVNGNINTNKKYVIFCLFYTYKKIFYILLISIWYVTCQFLYRTQCSHSVFTVRYGGNPSIVAKA